jgi:hypothetical protein
MIYGKTASDDCHFGDSRRNNESKVSGRLRQAARGESVSVVGVCFCEFGAADALESSAREYLADQSIAHFALGNCKEDFGFRCCHSSEISMDI